MIDIYTCQPRCLSVAYMTAVMTASANGMTVEQSGDGGAHWFEAVPHWNWATCLFRIKRPSSPTFKKGDWVIAINPAPNTLWYAHKVTKVRCEDGYLVFSNGLALAPHQVRHARANEIPGRGIKIGSYVISLNQGGTHHVVDVTSEDLQLIKDGVWYGKDRFRLATDAEIAAYEGSQLAEGHNPSKLTRAQVQTQDGWRLLDADEIKNRDHACCQFWQPGHGIWEETRLSYGGMLQNVYRTRLSRAELAALDAPKPKVKTPLCADDLPSLCWARRSAHPAFMFLVTYVGITHVSLGACANLVSFAELREQDWEYSADRINWKPCHKLV